MKTLKVMLALAVFLGFGRAAIGLIKTLDVWLLTALFIGCAATLPFMAYTLAAAPEPEPVQVSRTPTEDDFL